MKMTVKISMICATLMAATSVFAEPYTADSTIADAKINDKQIKTHTDSASHFYFGRREVIVDNSGIHFVKTHSSNFDDDFEDNYYHKYGFSWFNMYEDTHVDAFDFGMTGYGSKIFSTNIADSTSFMELNRGFHIAFGLCETSLPIVENRLYLGTDIGLKFDIYSFSNNDMILSKGPTHLVYSHDTATSYSKSKLRCTYLTVPLILEWQLGDCNDFYIMAGVEGNLRIGSSTKTKTISGYKKKHRNDLYMNRFSYNLVARVGIKGVGVFVKANMSPLFRDGKGPELYPFSAGISIGGID